MYACKHSRVEVIKVLLTIPTISIHLKGSQGKTALDRAKGKANEDEMKAFFQGELTSFLHSHSLSSLASTHYLTLPFFLLSSYRTLYTTLLPLPGVSFFHHSFFSSSQLIRADT
jgi:hypothetical protein